MRLEPLEVETNSAIDIVGLAVLAGKIDDPESYTSKFVATRDPVARRRVLGWTGQALRLNPLSGPTSVEVGGATLKTNKLS